MRLYVKPPLHESRVAEKSVKGALNLQDLWYLTIFICIIYLHTIFSVIETARAEIYLFTTGTPYKIDSRTLVFAPSGQGFFYSNLPARSHSGFKRSANCALGNRGRWPYSTAPSSTKSPAISAVSRAITPWIYRNLQRFDAWMRDYGGIRDQTRIRTTFRRTRSGFGNISDIHGCLARVPTWLYGDRVV